MEPVLVNLALSEIDPGERYRKVYTNIDSLAASIKDKGVIQPIAVMDRPGESYLLLAGGRRLAACTLLKMETIPCRVYPLLDDLTKREIELLENTQRENLTYAEEAELTYKIHELEVAKYGEKSRGYAGEGASYKSTAELLGKSRTLVGNELELARAIKEDPELANKKNKSEAFKELDRRKSNILMEELAARAKNRRMSEGTRKLVDAYRVGDFFKLGPQLQKGTFHLAEVDPPYAIGLDKVKRLDYDTSMQEYNEVEADSYNHFIFKTLELCYNLLSDNSWLVWWFAPDPWWEIVRQYIQQAGFVISSPPGIWYKPDQPGQTNQPQFNMAGNWEPFFYARKGSPSIMRQGRPNVFPFSKIPTDQKIHPTERPVELIADILSIFCPPTSNVLVPFAGSGNTLLACANNGLRGVGFDLSPEYKDKYTLRVTQQEGVYTSYGSF